MPAFRTDCAASASAGIGLAHVIISCGKASIAPLILEGIEQPFDRTSRWRCLRNRCWLIAVVVAHPLHLVVHVSLIATLGRKVEHVIGAHHYFHAASIGR